MPFHLPFNFPYFFNKYPYSHNSIENFTQSDRLNKKKVEQKNNDFHNEKKDSEITESSESFFEIFGLKLYFDDILIICILFFLYNEKVHNEELFVCLILLLIS